MVVVVKGFIFCGGELHDTRHENLVLSLKHAKNNKTLLNTFSEGLFGDQYIMLKT